MEQFTQNLATVRQKQGSWILEVTRVVSRKALEVTFALNVVEYVKKCVVIVSNIHYDYENI